MKTWNRCWNELDCHINQHSQSSILQSKQKGNLRANSWNECKYGYIWNFGLFPAYFQCFSAATENKTEPQKIVTLMLIVVKISGMKYEVTMLIQSRNRLALIGGNLSFDPQGLPELLYGFIPIYQEKHLLWNIFESCAYLLVIHERDIRGVNLVVGCSYIFPYEPNAVSSQVIQLLCIIWHPLQWFIFPYKW